MAPNNYGKKSKRKPLRKSKRRATRLLIAQLIKEKTSLNKNRDIAVASCATRTVELPSTNNIGEEKNKLLFMLSLGLIPNYQKSVEPTAIIPMEKLDHRTFLEAQAKTEERIKKILKKKLLDDSPQPSIQTPPSEPRILKLIPLKLLPEFEEKRVSPDIVEYVDLISDDEDTFDTSSSTIYNSYSLPDPAEMFVDLASSDDEEFYDNKLTNLKRQSTDKAFGIDNSAFPTPPSSGTASPITIQEFQNYRETMDFVNFHTAPKTGKVFKRKWDARRKTSRVSQITASKAAKVMEKRTLNSEQMSVGLKINCRLLSGKQTKIKNKSRNIKQNYGMEASIITLD